MRQNLIPPWKARYPLLTEAWLTVDQGVMKKSFPAFRLCWRDEMLLFTGPLRSNRGSSWQVELRLPPRYPEAEPHLWIIWPRLPDDTPHRYVDGRVCAHADPFVAWRTTAACMVSVLAGWLFRYERWQQEGIPWDTPLEMPGSHVRVNPDGSLYMKRRKRR